MIRLKTAFPAFALLLALAGAPAAAQDSQYKSLLTPLFQGAETIIGQPIAYPAGAPKVTAAVVVIAPGKDTGWHTHAVPLFVSVLEGEISVDYGSKGVKVYKPGDSFLEAMDWPHNATNKTDKLVRIMAFYMGAEGKADTAPAKGPQ
jgi:quercetin dioxygenase-like cupin family protein